MAGSNSMSRAHTNPMTKCLCRQCHLCNITRYESVIFAHRNFLFCLFFQIFICWAHQRSSSPVLNCFTMTVQITHFTTDFNFFLKIFFLSFFLTSFNPIFSWASASLEIQRAKLYEPHLASKAGILFCSPWMNWCSPQTGVCVASQLVTFIWLNIHIYKMPTKLWARHPSTLYCQEIKKIVWSITTESRSPPMIRSITP